MLAPLSLRTEASPFSISMAELVSYFLSTLGLWSWLWQNKWYCWDVMANQQDIFNLLLIWTANKINRNKTNLSPLSKHLSPKEPMLKMSKGASHECASIADDLVLCWIRANSPTLGWDKLEHETGTWRSIFPWWDCRFVHCKAKRHLHISVNWNFCRSQGSEARQSTYFPFYFHVGNGCLMSLCLSEPSSSGDLLHGPIQWSLQQKELILPAMQTHTAKLNKSALS